MTSALARPRHLDLDTFSRAAGLHPEVVRRFVALGLLEPAMSSTTELWFGPAQLARTARLRRLRAGFSLNYAALGLVLDLLDRIAELEAAGRTAPGRQGGRL
jgi:pimeloyl-ACP methyl ester carboxylesterase